MKQKITFDRDKELPKNIQNRIIESLYNCKAKKIEIGFDEEQGFKIKLNGKGGKKVTRYGDNYIFSIPKTMINTGLIDTESTYDVYAIKKEAKEDVQDKEL